MAGVDFTLRFDTKGAEDAFKRFSDHASESLEGISKSLEFLKIAFEALAVLEIGKKIAEGLEEAVQAASKADDAVAKLGITMKLAGDYSDEAAEHFEALAHHLQDTTRYSETQAISALGVAKSYGISNEAAEKLVRASADLAAVQGVDLVTATQELAKSYTGSARELGRLIPGVKNLTEAQLASGAAIDFVASKFNGAAEAASQTFAGSLDQTKNRFENLLETIGQFITHSPQVVTIIQTIGKGFSVLQDYLKANSSAIQEFIKNGINAMAQGLVNMVEGVRVLAQILQPVVKLIEFAALGAVDFINAFLKISAVNDLILDLAKILGFTVATVFKLIDTLINLPGVSTVFKGIGVNLDDVSSGLNNINDQILGFTANLTGKDLTDGLDTVEKGIISTIEKTDGLFDGVDKSLLRVKDVTQTVADAIRKAGDSQVDASKRAVDGFQKQEEELLKINKLQREQISNAAYKNPVAGIGAGLSNSGTFGSFDLPIDPTTGKPKVGSRDAAFIGGAAGIATNVASGASGASALLSSAVGAAADAFLPGIGGVVSQLVSVLSQGPDQIKLMVDQFAQALPTLIDGLIRAIPVLITELIKQIPNIIQAIVDDLPDLIQALIDSIPDIISALIEATPKIIEALAEKMPYVAIKLAEASPRIITEMIHHLPEFITEFAKGMLEIPGKFLSSLLKGLEDGIKNLFQNLLKGLGGIGSAGGSLLGGIGSVIGDVGSAVGGVISDVGSFFGFAEGGVVPEGFPNDSYPAKLTSGELVVPRQQVKRYKDFMQDAQGGSESGSISAKLDDLLSAIRSGGGQSGDVVLHQNLVLNEQVLSKSILRLNRNGFRMAT